MILAKFLPLASALSFKMKTTFFSADRRWRNTENEARREWTQEK